MTLKEIKKIDTSFSYKYKYCFKNYHFTFDTPFLLKDHRNYSLLNILEVFIYRYPFIFLLYLFCFILRPLDSLVINTSMNFILMLLVFIHRKYKNLKKQNFESNMEKIRGTITLKEYESGEIFGYKFKVSYSFKDILYQPYNFFTFYSDTDKRNEDHEVGDEVDLYLNKDFPEYVKSDNSKSRYANLWQALSIILQFISLNLILYYYHIIKLF